MAERLIDNKVVEMRFDNAQFEKNIQTSMNSIDELQKSLDNLHGGSAFDQLSKAASRVDLSGVEDAVYAVSERFTAMGIAGMTVVYRLTNAFINLGKTIWGKTFGQIKSGGIARALNIQQAEFMLEGLKLDVQQVKEDALAAVKDTAFGFDEAAKAAANFGASGIKAGKEMEGALRGVAGVAAMTNSDFSSIADIFSTVASNGKLMTMQLRQFSTRGLNVSAELAKVMNKSEAQINEMVTKGQIDFKTFANAMDEAFGKHAKDANKTLSGSLSNLKAALSRIGADFAEPIVTDFIPTVNTLRDAIDAIHESLSPLIEMTKDWSKIISTVFTNLFNNLKNNKNLYAVFQGISHIIMGIITVLYAMKKAFNEAFPQFNSMADAFRIITMYLIPTKEEFEGLVNLFKIGFSVIKMVVDAFIVGGKVLVTFGAVIYKIASVMLGLVASISDIIDPYIKWIKENNIIENSLYVVLSVIYDLIMGSELLQDAWNYLSENGYKLFDVLNFVGGVLKNFGGYFLDLVSSIDFGNIALIAFIVSLAFLGEAIHQIVLKGIRVFTGFFYTIYSIFKNIGNMFGSLTYMFKQIGHAFQMSSWEMVANIILKTALAIGILAVSMKLLSTIPTDNLIKAGAALVVLAGGLVAVGFAFKAMYGGQGLIAAGQALTFMSLITIFTGCLTVLSLVCILLGQFSISELAQGTITLTALGSLVIAMAHFSKKISNGMQASDMKNLSKVISQFIKIAGSMLVLAAAIKMLASIKEGLAKALAAFAVMSVIMVYMVTASEGLKGLNTNGFIKFGLTMILLAASLKIVSSIAAENGDALTDALFAIGILSAIILGVTKMQKELDAGLNSSGFIKFAATLLIMTGCLAILSSIAAQEDERLYKALLALFVMDAIIGVMMLVTKNLDTGINSSGFIKFAATLLLLTNCLTIISMIAMIDSEAMWHAVEAIGGLAAIAAGMVLVTQYLQSGINSSGFVKFAGALAIMTNCLLTLSVIDMISPDSLLNAVFAIGILSAITIVMVELTKTTSGIHATGFLEFAASILILSMAISVVVTSVGDNVDVLGNALLALTVLSLIGVVVMQMSQGLKSIHTFGFITFAAAILILSGAVAMLALLPDPNSVKNATESIIGLLLIMGVVSYMAQSFTIGAGTGLLIFASAILVMAGALAVLSLVWSENSLWQVSALILLGAGLAVVSQIANELNPASAAAMVIMASAILVLSGALVVLSNVPWPSLLAGAGAIALLLITLSVAGNVANYAIGGLAALSAILLSLGIVFLSFGVSAYLVADSVRILTESINNLAGISGEDIDQIIDNLNRFITGLDSVCDNILSMAPKFALAFSALGLAVTAVVAVIILAISNYAVVGMVLFAALLVESLPTLLDALGQIMDAVGVWFEENSEKVYEFGRQIGTVLMDGILGACEGIGEAIYDKTFGVDVKETYENWKKIGENSGNIYKENMLKAMDMYKSGEYSSDMLIQGLKTGIENGYLTEEEVMSELAKRGMSSFNEELGIHSPSLEGIKAGEYTIQGVIEGVRNKEYTFEEAMAAMAEGGIKAFKNKFQASDLLGGVTSSLGIGVGATDKYYQMGMAYASAGVGDSWKREYEIEGYKSIEDYVDAKQLQERNAVYEQIKKEIMSSLGLDKLDPEKALDKVTDTTNALGDLTTETDNATKATDNLKNAVKETLDVFTAFNEEATLTGRQVLQTFITQIRGVNTWQKEIQALGERGLNANFLQELADAGPDAYEKIHALYSMTEDELNLFNRMYAHKIVLERGTAKTIRDSFVQNGAMTVEAAKKFGENIADGAANKVAESGEKIKKSEQKALDEAAEELERKRIDEEFVAKWIGTVESPETTMSLANAFTKLGYESMDALQKSTNFEVIMDKLILFKSSLKEQLKGGLNLFEEVKTEEEKDKITATKLLDNMEENLKRVGGWSYNLRKMIKMGFSEGLVEELRQAGPESADKVEAFVKMTADEMAIANRYYAESTSLPDQLADRMVSAYADAGFTVSLGLKKGLEDGKDDLILQAEETGIGVAEGYVKGIDPDAANDVMKQLGSKSLSALKEELDSHSPSKKAEQIGIWFVEGFTLKEQMDWALRTIANTMGKFADAAIDTLSEKLSGNKTIEIARSFIQGFDVGIKKYSNVVGTSIGEVGNNIVKSFASALGVASPSVVAAEIMGYFLEGAMKPLTDDTTVAEAAKSQAMVIADMFKEGITEDMDGDVYSPTIRPVWDDSNIANGLIGLNNGLTGLSLSGTINTANSANRTGPSQDAVMITNAINNLYNEQRILRGEINNINSNVSSLGSRIDGMYVRLDGNALVGQIVSPMDKAMGKKVVTQKRGRV